MQVSYRIHPSPFKLTSILGNPTIAFHDIGRFTVPSFKQCHIIETKNHAFSVYATMYPQVEDGLLPNAFF